MLSCQPWGQSVRLTYSPFLPICPDTGQVLQAKVIATDPRCGKITYIDPRDSRDCRSAGNRRRVQITMEMLIGRCAGMRWVLIMK